MKCLIYSLIISFFSLNLLAEVSSYNKFTYSIKGEFEGLVKGDTISFERVNLPGWNLEQAVYVVVRNDGEFLFEGSAFHSQYFLMTYKPLSGKEVYADRMGVTLLVDSNALLLKGNVDDIYYCEIEGGIYDNADMREIMALDNVLGKGRAAFSRLITEANAAGDTDKMKEYKEQFNMFVANNRTEYDKLRKLEAEFAQKYPSAEWNIVERLQRVSYTPLDELNTYYASMEEQAQKSYYGMLLRQEIDNMTMLAPGNDAPDFILDAMDGQRIVLGDYAGFYLLIYHFGLCPGSLMIDQEVTSFYTDNKDKVKVLGITEDMIPIKEWFETVGSSDKMMDIELKPALESMVSHPWTDVENKGDNRQLAIDYAFAGLPYFILISPKGKILSRGFHETFYEAKKIIEEYQE